VERRTENLTAGTPLVINPDPFRHVKILQASGTLTITNPNFPLPATIKENQSFDFKTVYRGVNLSIVSTDTETVIFELYESVTQCHGGETPTGSAGIISIQGIWAWMTSHAQALWKLLPVGMAQLVGGGSYRIHALQTKDGVGLAVQEYTQTSGFGLLPTTFPGVAGIGTSGRSLLKFEIQVVALPAPPWTLGTLTVIDESMNVLPVFDMNGTRVPSVMDPTYIGAAFLVDVSTCQTLQFAPDAAFDGENYVDCKIGAVPSSVTLTP
jgi:hypothetical protein